MSSSQVLLVVDMISDYAFPETKSQIKIK